MATHSSILAWRIPWTEEPGGLQSTRSQRVGHDWATSLSLSCAPRSEVGVLYGSYFCIHSASPCVLVGAFNPFPFKVIIDIYLPIAIFLVVCSWFCRSFSFSCTSCTLTFVVKLVWWYWILLTFAFLKSFWFFHQFWMRSLLGTVVLVVDFSLSVL